MLQYRNCTPSDRPALLALLRELDPYFPIPLSRKTDLALYADKLLAQGTACCAWEAERPVGLLGFYANDLQTRTAYFSVLGILPSHQRRGIARQLMEQGLAHCRRAGMTRCCLYTHQTNRGAIALYRGLGFSETVTAQRPEDILFTKEL